MGPPPPPPPPPPPSGPPPNLGRKGGASNRNQLLNEIQQGARLKPTVCNDRSQPIVTIDKKSVGSASAGRLNNNASSSASVVSHGPTGGGGLFPGGVPSKPSDTKRFMATNGVPNSRTNSAAPPPQQQQPSTNGRGPSRQFSGVNGTQAAPQKQTASSSPSSYQSTDDSSSNTGRMMDSRKNMFEGGTQLKPFNTKSSTDTRPNQTPPNPPSVREKPALPTAPSSNKPAYINNNNNSKRAPDFDNRTMRPPRVSGPVPSHGLRKPTSLEDISAPPPPPRPPINRPQKPNVPPPPPPPVQQQQKMHVDTPKRLPAYRPTNDDDKPPPPPPRIESSAASSSSFEQRFQFIPLSSLPPPAVFSFSRKTYDGQQSNRRAAPSVPH